MIESYLRANRMFVDYSQVRVHLSFGVMELGYLLSFLTGNQISHSAPNRKGILLLP